jgi:hypothetical protein
MPQIPDTAETGPLPPLPLRLAGVFFSPGRLMEQLAAEPRWLGVMLVTTVLSATTAAVVPPELILETVRQQMVEQGADVSQLGERQANLIRYARVPAAVIFPLVLQFGIAALYSVLFLFVLGDEGRYTQYLAAVSHAWFIPVVIGVLLLPLVIRTGNLELRLNLEVFLRAFLEPGFVRSTAKQLDLTVIWSILVIAQGAHSIDRRRSFGGAAAIMLSIFVIYAMGVGFLEARSIG